MERGRIRFRLDEHIPHAVAFALRDQEIDVETADDAGQVGVIDRDVLATCLVTGRVIVTFDRDFPKLHNQGARHAGIAYAPKGRRSIGEVVAHLLLLAGVYTSAEMDGRLEYL